MDKDVRTPTGQALVCDEAATHLHPSGFDPSRNNPADYTAGWNDAINICGGIAEKWRDENKAARDKALVRGRERHRFDGDETHLVLAEQLDGAAIECNAIAGAIRMHAIATEAGTAESDEEHDYTCPPLSKGDLDLAFDELHGCMIRHPEDTCEVRKEFLAVALEILDAAIATEARRAETPKSDSVHEGAGRKASPKASPDSGAGSR